jgi:hypothetical protein
LPDCCPRAASGQASIPALTTLMKSRRLMGSFRP